MAQSEQVVTIDTPLGPVIGTLDTTVLPTAVDAFPAAHDGEETTWIAAMDHVFNAFTGPDTLDQMVGETATFLKAHLN
jgi:hypothetical protein